MAKAESTPRDIFLDSLKRCEESRRFLPSFYQRFLDSSEEVRDKFKHTDFEKQERMLLRSLELSAKATAGDPHGLRELRERAETHDNRHLDIPPRLYELWLIAIIGTAGELDPQWDAEIEHAWRTILAHVIERMIAHYQSSEP